MKFCEITDELVLFLRKYAKGRKIIDMGAGECQLRDAMEPGEVVSVEFFPKPSLDLEGVYAMDARDFPLDYDTMLPVFIRPCHGTWVHDICTSKINDVASFLYIGLSKNLWRDLDQDSDVYKVTAILRPYTGTEGEKAWQIVPRDCHTDDTLYTFRLVRQAYGSTEKKSAPFWYELSESGKWYYNMVGGKTPVGECDEVLGEVQANRLEDLDWHGTALDDPAQDAGYLDRGGRFYGCASRLHIKCAKFVLKKNQQELERLGWVHIYGPPGHAKESWGRDWICMKSLSAEQRNWLSYKGYKLRDWD